MHKTEVNSLITNPMDKREPFQILLSRKNYADPKLPVHVYAEIKITELKLLEAIKSRKKSI